MELGTILCLLFGVSISIVKVNGDESLDEIENRLNAFEKKLSQFDALVDGLSNFCSVVQEIKEKEKFGEKPMNPSIEIPQIDGSDEESIAADVDDDNEEWNEIKKRPLKLVSFESGGLVNKEIDLSITYIADAGYIAEWFLSRQYHGHTTRDNGQVTKELLENDRIKFTTKTTVRDLDSISWASLIISSTAYSAQISLNISALSEKGTQMFHEPNKKILQMIPRITVPADELKSNGFNTTITVSENVIEGMNEKRYRPNVAISLINAKASPPEFIEFWAKDYDSNLTFTVKNGSDNEVVVSLTEHFAVYGGIIQIWLPQTASGYIRDFSYGNEFKLINQDIGDVMPHDTFGLYKPRERMYVQGPYLSHTCLAFGVPLPAITLLKREKDGSLVETEIDYEYQRGIYKLSVLQFEPNKPSKPEGDYVCQASNGNQTVQYKTTYLPLQEVEIDVAKTRLIKNTTEKTIVTCKASGHPTPKLELTADYEYGQNLIESSSARYKHKFNTRKNVSKVTLLILPPDESISTIYCVAKQTLEANVEIRKTKAIKIRDLQTDDGYDSYHSITNYNYTVSVPIA